MDDAEYRDLTLIAPIINTTAKARACVVDITTSSARTNLATLLPQLTTGTAQLYDITADGGNVYFFMNSSDAGTIDEAATGAGVTVAGEVLFNGVTKPQYFPAGHYWLVAKGSAACKLRIRVSSLNYGQIVGAGTGDL